MNDTGVNQRYQCRRIYRESTSSEIEYAESIIKRLNNGSKELSHNVYKRMDKYYGERISIS